MKKIVTLFLICLLAACSMLPEVQDETKTWSANKLYAEAKFELDNKNYTKAIKLLETLEARYPYGRFAQQAQLEIAYAYYKDNEPASAIAAADRFIKLHPTHPHVDYAYYLKGLVNFNEQNGFLSSLSQQDMTERDPKAARESFEAFRELAVRFPNSKYTPDAVARMQYLVNSLALHEVHVARYYLNRGAYIAAANRAQYAVKNYPNTPPIEEALTIMIKAYDALGMTELRDDAQRVLEKTYPNQAGSVNETSKKTKPWWRVW